MCSLCSTQTVQAVFAVKKLSLKLTFEHSRRTPRPFLNTVQMKDVIAVGAAPDGRLRPDDVTADHALVRVTEQFLDQRSYRSA